MWRSQWLTRQLCGKAPEEVWEQERAGTASTFLLLLLPTAAAGWAADLFLYLLAQCPPGFLATSCPQPWVFADILGLA